MRLAPVAPVVLVVISWIVAPRAAFAQVPGADTSTGLGFLPEPRPITRAAALASRRLGDRPPKDGFFLELGNMITGSGWISAGPGYRRRVFSHRALFSTSAAVSWRLYTMARASLDVDPASHRALTYGGTVFYQDALQVNYFGIGNESPASARSGYRMRSLDTDAHAAYTRGPWTVQGRVGWMPATDVRSMAGWLPKYPNTEATFTEATAPGLTSQPAFGHLEIGASVDQRDRPGRPTSGGAFSVSLARYADLDRGTYTFNLLQADATQYVPLVRSRWVAALRAWGAFTGTDAGHLVPFYLMPNIGGKNTMRGYADYRFHGAQMVVLSAESRWALFDHVDAALFVDAGRVADRVRDLGLSGFHESVGAGIRFHTDAATLARLDVAHGTEGWYVVFKLTEPFTRKTFSGRRTPTIPFVP